MRGEWPGGRGLRQHHARHGPKRVPLSHSGTAKHWRLFRVRPRNPELAEIAIQVPGISGKRRASGQNLLHHFLVLLRGQRVRHPARGVTNVEELRCCAHGLLLKRAACMRRVPDRRRAPRIHGHGVLVQQVVRCLQRWRVSDRLSMLWSRPSDKSCITCLLYTSPSPRDRTRSRMPSSA